MFFSITLNKDNIGCDRICSSIQKLISQYSREHSDLIDSVLVIEIKPTNDSQMYQEPLCITHKTD